MKMVPLYRNVISVIIFIICASATINAKKAKYNCPIGFNLAYTKYKGDDPMCYRRKGPEFFADKFKDCAGNLYTLKLYSNLNISDSSVVLWTDYKSLYPGGPFIDWSYTEDTGSILVTTYDIKYDSSLGLDEEFCVVIDPVTNFTATRCSEMHYRYCFVRPYSKEGEMEIDGCRDLKDYWRFMSPQPSCLTAVTGVGGGTVRANWRQAKELCSKRGGSLLSKSWRYANHPLLSTNLNPTFPLGILLSPDNSSIRYDTSSDDVIPSSEWHFDTSIPSNDTSLGALRDNFWYMVNGSYIFYDVICERAINLKPVSLNVSIDIENKLVLKTSEPLNEKDVYCYTDSAIYFPTQVKLRYDDYAGYYVLKPIADGHYWCVHVDSRNHTVSDSNTALFIREKQSLINYYAVMIKLKNEYNFENLEASYRDWKKNLEDYIFYYTKYVQIFGELKLGETADSEEIIQNFKLSHPGLQWRERELIYKIKIKRLFLDKKSALVHVQLNPEMMPVAPGKWNDLEVIYMKPVYFCKGFDTIPTLSLGFSITSAGCRNYSCVGDFDDGVQWVATAVEACTTLAPLTITESVFYKGISDNMPTGKIITDERTPTESPNNQSSSSEEEKIPPPSRPPSTTLPSIILPTDPQINITEVITTTESYSTTSETVSTAIPTFPPTSPRPPQEQLLDVMENLENLLQNDSLPVTMGDLNRTFDKVDNLLETQDELDIPGELLHLLDELGARIDLNGSNQAATVRSNIALLLADSRPSAPVRGLRIAAREEEAFTESAFEILSDQVNSTHLSSNNSEAVVHLPESVAGSSRRISFVVFRTDRAFNSNSQNYRVNSRVLSINVENITKFKNGEVIDIHFNPIKEEFDRNQSRTCAYWRFTDDGSGYWSQDGCTLIKSTEEGVLDTCRCTHLTHFAEILVSRTLFSERNEAALEVLTIIGCVLSIFGLFMVGLTAALFRSWRRDYSNKIWLQLCIAIFVLVVCFLIIIFSKFDTYDIPCMLIGVALHYSVLASFCWMLVAAILSYRRLVIVFTRDASHKLLRASAFSWGAPCAIVGILLSVEPHSYAGQFDDKTPGGAFCYPSGLGLWLAVYMPIAIMLFANWILFALIVRSVFASRRIQRHGDSNEALRCASVSCLLVFLFGLPWIFGMFAHNVVAAYFFTLTATFQGFILFLFFVLGNKKTRDLWLNKLKIKQTRKVPVTSSTYTNRSTGPGYRGTPGAATIEANSSKPKSLASPDNSRFS